MDNLKRYDLFQCGDYSQVEGVMIEVSNGDWVKAEDYDALKEEADRLRKLIEDAVSSAKDTLSTLQES